MQDGRLPQDLQQAEIYAPEAPIDANQLCGYASRAPRRSSWRALGQQDLMLHATEDVAVDVMWRPAKARMDAYVGRRRCAETTPRGRYVSEMAPAEVAPEARAVVPNNRKTSANDEQLGSHNQLYPAKILKTPEPQVCKMMADNYQNAEL